MTDKPITPREALDAMLACHRGYYIEAGKQDLAPMYWLFRESGEMLPVLLTSMPKAYEERNGLANIVRKQAAKLGDVFMFAFVSEAWTLPPMSEKEYRDLKVMPSQSERRIEVITTLIGHRDGTRLIDNHELVRDKSGRVVELKPLGTHESTSTQEHIYSRFDLFTATDAPKPDWEITP
jgi:hypothetical protein